MTSNTQTGSAGRPRRFGQHTYVLPASVQSNIPPYPSRDEVGRCAYARGLLVEISRTLPCTPLALYVRLCTDHIGNPTAVVITVIAQDEHDEILTIVWRQERGLNALGPNHWQLTINGAIPHRGTDGSDRRRHGWPTSSAAPSPPDPATENPLRCEP
jgi:hypothetical protein